VLGPLTIAAGQPQCTSLDVVGNAQRHADVVRAARARVVVFPELSLTGYELAAEPVAPDDVALAPLVEACAETGSLALVGAPIAEPDGPPFIAILQVDAAGARIAYRKSWLGGAEPARFRPGDGPTVLTVDGWRIGLGICKDTGTARHVAGTAALGVDVYAAGLVHAPEELPEQEARAVVIARTCRAFVVFASFAGPTDDGYGETAGCSAIWSPDGLAIARTGPAVGGLVRAVLTDPPGCACSRRQAGQLIR
jgi:predicted amidohydrolase